MPCSVHFTRGIRVAVFCPHPPSQRPPPPCSPALLSLSPLCGAAAIFISLSFLRKREKKQSKKQTLSRFLISLFLSVARPSLPSGSQKNQKRLRAAAMRRYIISDTAAEKEQGVRLGEQVTCFCTRTREVEGVKSEKDASLSVIHRDSQTNPDPGPQGHGHMIPIDGRTSGSSLWRSRDGEPFGAVLDQPAGL